MYKVAIHHYDGTTETPVDALGPFASQAEAGRAIAEYCAMLDEGDSDPDVQFSFTVAEVLR